MDKDDTDAKQYEEDRAELNERVARINEVRSRYLDFSESKSDDEDDGGADNGDMVGWE